MKSCHLPQQRGYYAKQNKSDKKRQIPYVFTYKWNRKNKTRASLVT